MDYKLKEIQDKTRKLLDREQINCVSGLFEEMLEKGIVDYEDLENLYLDKEKALEYGYSEEEAEEGVMQEPLEWYFINDWLYEQLKKRGEVVYNYADFNYFWGRTCSGQSVVLDNVFQELAEEYVKR